MKSITAQLKDRRFTIDDCNYQIRMLNREIKNTVLLKK